MLKFSGKSRMSEYRIVNTTTFAKPNSGDSAQVHSLHQSVKRATAQLPIFASAAAQAHTAPQ